MGEEISPEYHAFCRAFFQPCQWPISAVDFGSLGAVVLEVSDSVRAADLVGASQHLPTAVSYSRGHDMDLSALGNGE